eukprot:2027100-Rhodomonas_salina.4
MASTRRSARKRPSGACDDGEDATSSICVQSFIFSFLMDGILLLCEILCQYRRLHDEIFGEYLNKCSEYCIEALMSAREHIDIKYQA